MLEDPVAVITGATGSLGTELAQSEYCSKLTGFSIERPGQTCFQ